MKLKLIDREKKGFARYCPTFAKAYECAIEGIRKKRFETLEKLFSRDERMIPMLAESLGDRSGYVRTRARVALEKAAVNGKGGDAALDALVEALGDARAVVRRAGADGLWSAAKGADITAAIPALVKALGDEDSGILASAAGALGAAAEKGADVTAAIPALVKALGCGSANAREIVAKALEKAAHNEDQKTRTLVVNEIMGFMRSDWFQDEMWKNSVTYEKIAIGIARLLSELKEAEEKAA